MAYEDVPDVTITFIREPDWEWLDLMLATIRLEWVEKHEHRAPKRFELRKPA